MLNAEYFKFHLFSIQNSAFNIRFMQPLGQHFLISRKVLDRIIEAAELTSADTVLEIGPGKGVLTHALAERVRRVIAVEKDRGLAEGLKKEFALMPHVEIITADIRDALNQTTHCALRTTHYKVVANIPYYLTSRLIRLLLEHEHAPKLIALMIQREVAERVMAKPPRMNLLALSVQIYGTPEIISLVPRNAFKPPPKVESAIIRIRPHIRPLVTSEAIESLFRLAHIGFGQKRKTLVNNLVQGLKITKDHALKTLARAGIDPSNRAQTLSLEEWLALTKILEI
jgi:16S rRNA (adenine1518-N6/adenine1519-N6)-dimethyltransferase